MARVTVEDCIEKIPNRFDLVLAAAQRARNISTGNPLTIDRDNDKNPVVALREIAEETIDPDFLRDEMAKYNLDAYLNMGGTLEIEKWRTLPPSNFYVLISGLIKRRLLT